MAEDTKPDAAAAEEKPKKPLPLAMILGVLNTVALLGVVGLLVYTKVLYKRPAITESTERDRIEAENEKVIEAPTGPKALVKLDPIQAGLRPSRIGAQTRGGPPPQLKPHYLSMTIAFEINDPAKEDLLKSRTPQFLDEILRSLGNTTVEELSTVQGRFILRSKLIGIMNGLVKNSKNEPPLVTNVYFSDFMVQ